MTPTQQLVGEAMLARRFKSHYALAKTLGISLSRMSTYTTGRCEIGDETIVARLAEFAGRDPLVTVAEFHALTTKEPGAADIWFRMMERLKLTAAAALVGSATVATGVLYSPESNASNGAGFEAVHVVSVGAEDCILCKVPRAPRRNQKSRISPFVRRRRPLRQITKAAGLNA